MVFPSRRATRCSVSRLRSPTVSNGVRWRLWAAWFPFMDRRSSARMRAFSSRMLKGFVT